MNPEKENMRFAKSKTPKVNAYLEALEGHPLADLFLEIRKTVLKAVPGLVEDIKWRNCLTYAAEKNLIQTVLGKQHITLIFFDGVALKDPKGLLEGDGAKTRSARFDALPLPEKALIDLVKQAAKASKA